MPALPDALEERRPGREEVLLGEAVRGDAQQHLEAGPHPLTLVRGDAVPHEGGVQHHREVGAGVLSRSGEPAADRLGDGPEGDTFPIGEATPAVPADRRAEPVDVLLQLPRQAGLADPGLAVDQEQGGPAPRLGVMEELLDQPQLALPSDERGLQPVGPLSATARGDDGAGAPQGHRVGLALSWWLPASAYVMAPELSSRVVSSTQTCPGPATDCTRDAVLTASPATIPCCSAPTVTATSPVTTPTRAASPATPTSSPMSATRVTSSNPARTARSASSSWDVGTPHTAITASPMNFSTVPPYRPMIRRASSKYLVSSSLVSSWSRDSESVVNPTRSQNNTS